jgi:O-antigen/teichoic acid export membrane protein
MTYSKFHLLGDTGNSILMAMIILPFWVWVILNRAFLRGMKLLGSALIGFQIVRPGLAAVFTGIAYYFGIVGPYQAIVFLSSALVVTIVINNYQINTALGSTKHTPRYEIKHWKATAKPLFLSTVLSALMSRADMVMVGSLLGMEEAARYAVAHRLAILLTFALDAVRTTLTPQISEYYHKKNSEILQKKMTQASQLIFFTTVPLAALLLFFPQVFLGLFGEGYKSAGNILIFLTIGQLINSLTGTVSPLLTMTAYQGIHARIIGVTLAIYLLLNFVLIKLFGAEGAAIATSIIIGVRNIWLVIVAKEKLNIITYMRPKDIFLRLHLKSLFGRKMGK